MESISALDDQIDLVAAAFPEVEEVRGTARVEPRYTHFGCHP